MEFVEQGGWGLGVVFEGWDGKASSVRNMATSMSDRVLRQLRYTPLGDLLRGRVSGRLDVKRSIEASGLPAPAKELVHRVVKRTRLWLGEKVDVANELIAHFVDGIENGRSVEELIDKFGDERK